MNVQENFLLNNQCLLKLILRWHNQITPRNWWGVFLKSKSICCLNWGQIKCVLSAENWISVHSIHTPTTWGCSELADCYTGATSGFDRLLKRGGKVIRNVLRTAEADMSYKTNHRRPDKELRRGHISRQEPLIRCKWLKELHQWEQMILVGFLARCVQSLKRNIVEILHCRKLNQYISNILKYKVQTEIWLKSF